MSHPDTTREYGRNEHSEAGPRSRALHKKVKMPKKYKQGPGFKSLDSFLNRHKK